MDVNGVGSRERSRRFDPNLADHDGGSESATGAGHRVFNRAHNTTSSLSTVSHCCYTTANSWYSSTRYIPDDRG